MLHPMTPERRIRHHYIPQFLQKHFCDADGMLWYGIRDTQVVKSVSPVDAFIQKDLYTSYKDPHERSDDIAYEPDDKFERRFAEEIENQAAPAIERLIAGTRHLVNSGSTDLLGQLSSAEISACKQLLISSMNRTPDAIESAVVRSGARSNQAIWKLVRQELDRFPKPVQDEFFHRYLRSAAVDVASSSHRDVLGRINLDECGLVVAANSSSTRRFIFGSCGVAVLPDAEDDLGGDWLPISPDQAIGLYDDPANLRLHKDWGGSTSPDQRGAGEAEQVYRGRFQELGRAHAPTTLDSLKGAAGGAWKSPSARPANSRHSMAVYPLLTHVGTRRCPTAGNADRTGLYDFRRFPADGVDPAGPCREGGIGHRDRRATSALRPRHDWKRI